jgi:hypothetical protein
VNRFSGYYEVLENVDCFDDGLDVSPFSLSNVGYNLGVLAEEVLEFVNALLTLPFLRILLLQSTSASG